MRAPGVHKGARYAGIWKWVTTKGQPHSGLALRYNKREYLQHIELWVVHPWSTLDLRYESLLTWEVIDRLSDRSGAWREQNWKTGDKEIWESKCGLSEWVQNVKAVVFYINASQGTSTAKKTLTESGGNKMTHPVDVRQSLSPAIHCLLSGYTKKVAMAAGMLCVSSTWTSPHQGWYDWSYHWVPNGQWQKPKQDPQYGVISPEWRVRGAASYLVESWLTLNT